MTKKGLDTKSLGDLMFLVRDFPALDVDVGDGESLWSADECEKTWTFT